MKLSTYKTIIKNIVKSPEYLLLEITINFQHPLPPSFSFIITNYTYKLCTTNTRTLHVKQ